MNVVEIKDVSKRFGDTTALQGIDLSIEEREFISLIGPSGCGKSTLLRIIGDLIQPTTGTASVNGKPARQARIDRDYGIVFQDAVLYDWRVAIARALSLDPALLLMDEPFGALDEMTRERMNMELLRIWEASGSTVVFVTHSIAEAVFLSTRVVVLSPRPGRISDLISIDLSQPRTAATREEPRFFELVTDVREALHLGHDVERKLEAPA